MCMNNMNNFKNILIQISNVIFGILLSPVIVVMLMYGVLCSVVTDKHEEYVKKCNDYIQTFLMKIEVDEEKEDKSWKKQI